jgi:hypothetical protein
VIKLPRADNLVCLVSLVLLLAIVRTPQQLLLVVGRTIGVRKDYF